jgi:hypothetical protein
MPEFLQNVDIGTALLITVGCVLLCGVGFLLFFGIQIIGGLFGTIFGFLELFIDILAGGPVAWCGCLLLLSACAVCAGLALFISQLNCETDPIMFCRFLGY